MGRAFKDEHEKIIMKASIKRKMKVFLPIFIGGIFWVILTEFFMPLLGYRLISYAILIFIISYLEMKDRIRKENIEDYIRNLGKDVSSHEYKILELENDVKKIKKISTQT